MSVITEDFVAAGKPTYIVANAGITYTDITDGIIYRQTTIPYGKNWKVISNQNVYIPNSGVTSVKATTPLASSGGTGPTISIQQAGPTQSGYLSSADWNTFNAGSTGGVPSTRTIATTAPLQGGGDLSADRTLSIPQASNTINGYLSSGDWITFNNKGNGTVTAVTGTSPIVSSGGNTPAISIPQAGSLTDGYLSASDWGVFNSRFPYPTGTTSQYIRGDGSLDTFPTVPTVTPAALTKTDDTNVTLTLGGTPNTSLLQAVSLSLGWSGTLADSRISSAFVWNAKQNALAGSGLVKSTAGTISYVSGTSAQFVKGDGSLDSSTYLTSAVTSVGATAPITSSGGTTPSISTSMATNKLIGRSTAGTGVMEEISVGTGLSLSGGTLSNSSPFTTPLTTKGDIYVRNGSADTRLPVGLDTQMLLADSTAATGLKWTSQPAATPTGYYLAISDSTIQDNPTANIPRAIKFNTTDLANGFSLQTETAVFTGTINNGGAGAGTILNVTGVTSGTLKVGMVLTGGPGGANARCLQGGQWCATGCALVI